MSHRRADTEEFDLYEVSKEVQLIEAVSTMVFARGWGHGEKERCYSMGIGLQLHEMRTFQRSAAQYHAYSKQYCAVHLKMCEQGRAHVTCSYPNF